jgi:hypothetical protein
LVGAGAGDCGLGVDARGNIYVASNIKLADQPLPKEFAGKVPAQAWIWWKGTAREAPWKYMYCNPYLFHLGALLKFGPDGGAVYGSVGRDPKQPGVKAYLENAPPGSAAYRTGYLNAEARVAGAKWHFLGVGPIPASGLNWGDPMCVCTMMHLAADPWGRVYAPNCFRFGVEVLDTNGNRLMRIGRYGNADDAWPGIGKAGPPPGERGTAAGAPDPRIRFVYPRSVSWAREKLYVLDGVNTSVTVVRFEASASAECAVP